MLRRLRGAGAAAALSACLAACLAAGARADLPPDGQVGDTPLRYSVTPAPQRFAAPPALAALGKRIFFDPGLSQPRGLSCAGCHDPAQGYAGDRGAAAGVAPGSVRGRFGVRNTPTVLYARYVPRLYFYQDDDSPVPGPRGGLFADGRAETLAELPAGPLLNPLEMNNRDAAMVARKLAGADYAAQLRQAFGVDVFRDPRRSMRALGQALQAFLDSDEMAPFSSRYDRFIAGQAPLSAQELRGMALFRDPYKGNCASCHEFNETSANPARSLFTDFGYDAVAAPRNPAIPANHDPRHYDLGLCATAAARHWPDSGSWCGYFRTPTLRNVALRQRYMHNGVFRELRSVVAFYATRATDPARWYPAGLRFDDLPPRYHGNVNVNSVPYNRRPGVQPALNDAEIDAIVAFLGTLSDALPAPAAAPSPAAAR